MPRSPWHPRAILLVLLPVLLLLGGACEDKVDPFGDDPGEELPAQVTYLAHVRDLLEAHCTTCHASYRQGAERQGAPASVDLDSYEGATDSGDRSNTRIQAGTMPPAGPLSTYDRALFQRWIDQGMTRE